VFTFGNIWQEARAEYRKGIDSFDDLASLRGSLLETSARELQLLNMLFEHHRPRSGRMGRWWCRLVSSAWCARCREALDHARSAREEVMQLSSWGEQYPDTGLWDFQGTLPG